MRLPSIRSLGQKGRGPKPRCSLRESSQDGAREHVHQGIESLRTKTNYPNFHPKSHLDLKLENFFMKSKENLLNHPLANSVVHRPKVAESSTEMQKFSLFFDSCRFDLDSNRFLMCFSCL
jgi:hypothetical protein